MCTSLMARCAYSNLVTTRVSLRLIPRCRKKQFGMTALSSLSLFWPWRTPDVFRIKMRVLPTHGRQLLIGALLMLALTSPAVFSQQKTAAAPEVLTLDQAINIALKDNRTVKNAQLAVEKSDEQLGAARTARLPSFKLYTVVSEDLVKHNVNLTNPFAGIFPGVGPFFTVGIERKPTAVFAAQVVQPISQQYRIGLGLNLLKLERQVDQEKL